MASKIKKYCIYLDTVNFNGVFTFNKTLALFLREWGFEVSFFIKKYKDSEFACLKELHALGTTVSSSTAILVDADVVFVNHNSANEYFNIIENKARYVVHSLLVNDHIPNLPWQLVYCLSERMLMYPDLANFNLIRIRNFIDKRIFPRRKDVPTQLKKVLVIDSLYGSLTATPFIQTCGHFNFYVSIKGRNNYFDSRGTITYPCINEADLVVCVGRTCVEALYVGTPVLNYGVNGGSGLITEANFDEYSKTNFSVISEGVLPAPTLPSALPAIYDMLRSYIETKDKSIYRIPIEKLDSMYSISDFKHLLV